MVVQETGVISKHAWAEPPWRNLWVCFINTMDFYYHIWNRASSVQGSHYGFIITFLREAGLEADMPLYGSIFYEAIPSPPWPVTQPFDAAWLDWALGTSLSFPIEMGSEVLFFFFLSLLIWKFYLYFFLVEIIFHTSDKSRWYLHLINHWVILKQDKDYPFRKLYPISNTQNQMVLTTLFCQVWWLVSIILALGKLRQESLRLTWTA